MNKPFAITGLILLAFAVAVGLYAYSSTRANITFAQKTCYAQDVNERDDLCQRFTILREVAVDQEELSITRNRASKASEMLARMVVARQRQQGADLVADLITFE
jgi:hypothetical protein